MMEAIAWGEVFALGSAISWALAVVMLRQQGRLLPAFELNLFKNVLGFLLFIPTLWLMEGLSLPEYSLQDLGIALLSGYLGIAVADTWYLRALNLMGASRSGIATSLLSPFVILLSVLFLGESLGGWQIPGLILVLSGILLVTWKHNRSEVDHESVRKGAQYAIGAVFLMAVGIVMVKEILETRPFLWTVEIRLFGGLFGMIAVMVIRRRVAAVRASFSMPLPWAQITIASLLSSYIAMMLWLAGYKLIPASKASILNESAVAWIVLFAWLVLGESLSLRKVLGLMLTMTGVAIMLLV
jgi:drug/metabolite transporter (DMT)-like permease